MRGAREIPVASMGIGAGDALRAERAGRVEAVFARSFYLRLGQHWICIGEPSIGRGPINLVLDAPLAALAGLRAGETARGGPDGIGIGGTILRLDQVEVWRPRRIAGWTPESLARGIAALRTALSRALLPEGMGTFVGSEAAAPCRTARAARPAVAALSAWLALPAGSAPPAGAVRSLLGLGPGLTPSGDDFLAGALAALRLTGSVETAGALWAAIDRHAPARTSPLSLAHIRAASRIGLSETLHGLLTATLAGDERELCQGVETLSAKAASSPFDALAGCATALDGFARGGQADGRSVEAAQAGPP